MKGPRGDNMCVEAIKKLKVNTMYCCSVFFSFEFTPVFDWPGLCHVLSSILSPCSNPKQDINLLSFVSTVL